MFKVTPDLANQKVIIQIRNLISTQKTAIRRAFYFSGKDLVKTSKAMIMEKPKHGRLYRLKKHGLTVLHRASAPGEAPANFTGALKNSVDFTVSGAEKMIFGSRLYFPDRKGTPAGVKYGGYLEHGTKKIAPRPYLEPSIVKNYRNIQTHFEKHLKQKLTGYV